ncbi:FKBP-type peptidyl-prolyl cis-trans isomerase [Neptunomonas phycophila]|jgi:FKBP-type peptidyl-prolyl cis-trans isomerase FklB|uniref:FKBP-type peptidyl-prolyl cis-trans isomerase n=1 Tax=Neptunomonas TaxID=75687 RepID=UPI00094910AF|nr:FKBP-type peptidyl-prolyl cis-trans isomerase [Neptunomonas phycophila]QLE99086.1 FKBP-type peptidyl-prolyl cis-trans isomerase [Neptunomonas phycophila]
MKKTLLAMTVASTIALMPVMAHAVDLDSEDQKVSYSLGLILGEKLKQDMDTLDLEAFQAGLKSIYEGATPELDAQQVGETMQAFQAKKMEEQRKLVADLAQKNLEAGEAFLAENAKRDGVVTTDSGLQFEEVVAGTGKQPSAEDTVKVHYRGTLIDGTEFDSSYSRNEPVSFPLNGVIPGWTEALQMMKEGGKAKLAIPSDLAYGPGGMGNAIGPNSTLVFDVELLEVNPSE